MAKGKGSGENSKKAAGNARKAEAAAKKNAELDAQKESAEAEQWSQGAKGKNAKKEAEAAKKAEAKASKAARDAELEAETSKAAAKKPLIKQKKAAPVSSRGSGIDAALAGSDLNAHNIEDAIAALELTTGKSSDKIDRHPERRFKPALRVFEERRLPELRKERPGLRLNQYQNLIYEEFKKSPENPFNQVNVAFNASREDIKDTMQGIKKSHEDRLAH